MVPVNYCDYVKAHKKLAPFTSGLIARTLMEADKRLERQKNFIKRIDNAKALSLQRFNKLPRNATIRNEYVRCGKSGCEISHGPYYYAYWKETVVDANDNGIAYRIKLKKKYIGSYLPKNDVASAR